MVQVAETVSIFDINHQSSQPEEGEKFLRFPLNSTTDGLIPLGELQEVCPLAVPTILPVPEVPRFLLGIINWRGKATWIVDLGSLWGAPHWCQREPIAEAGMALLLPWKEETIGLLIEEIKTVEIFNPQHPNFSQNLRSPNTEALQEVGLNRAIADFPNQQSVVRF